MVDLRTSGESRSPAVGAHESRSNIVAWSGLGFVVSQLVPFVLTPAPPAPDATGSELRDFFVQERSGILWSGLIQIVGMAMFLLVVAGVATTVRRSRDGDLLATVASISGTAAAALVIGALAIYSSIVWVDGAAEEASEGLLRFNLGAPWLLFAASALAISLLAGTMAVASLRDHIGPSWLGWASAISAIAGVVAVGASIDSSIAALGMLGFAGVLVFVIAYVIAELRGDLAY